MPQLDLYTYFTQFQWLIVIFTLLFLLINGQFIPTFQSLFEARNALHGPSISLDGNRSNEEGALKGFDKLNITTSQSRISNPSASSNLVISKFDKIFDKYASSRLSKKSSIILPSKPTTKPAPQPTSGKKSKAQQSSKKGRGSRAS
jgi:hypothetical protein